MGLVSRKTASQQALTNVTNLTNPLRRRGRARTCTRVCVCVVTLVTLGRLVQANSSKGFSATNLFFEVGQVGQS
jgi:hypothetical protein